MMRHVESMWLKCLENSNNNFVVWRSASWIAERHCVMMRHVESMWLKCLENSNNNFCGVALGKLDC